MFVAQRATSLSEHYVTGHATAKLEGMTGKLSGLYTDLESEKQVCHRGVRPIHTLQFSHIILLCCQVYILITDHTHAATSAFREGEVRRPEGPCKHIREGGQARSFQAQ